MKNNTKKICIITTISLSIKSFFLEQIAYLSENGYEVTIICDKDEELINVLHPDVRYIPVPMKRGLDPLGAVKAIKRMYQIFKEKTFDIVQYSTPNAALYASIASKLAGVKIRLYHNMGYRYAASEGIKRVIFKTLEKITCRLSTEIQPVSFSNLEFGVKEKLFPRNKARVIWNGSTGGVNLTKFDINKKEEWKNEIFNKYEIGSETFVFGFVGRITRDKGINELLGAYQKLSLENKDINLMLVGNEEDTDSLNQELYNWAKNRKDIIFTGLSEEVHKYFAAFNVMILPSYREGFGNVVIEAQAMGVPVIVSDIPGPTDAMKKGITGLVVGKQDINELLESMIEMKNAPKKCEEMGQRAYIYIKDHFDSKQLMQNILKDKDRLTSM
ncbi:MAG: glycosyltransferase family 4 protein [Niameybacter sp.]|nr:glycosyltransferase family 4 protein [Niameybacter sp.]